MATRKARIGTTAKDRKAAFAQHGLRIRCVCTHSISEHTAVTLKCVHLYCGCQEFHGRVEGGQPIQAGDTAVPLDEVYGRFTLEKEGDNGPAVEITAEDVAELVRHNQIWYCHQCSIHEGWNTYHFVTGSDWQTVRDVRASVKSAEEGI